jgi:acyl-CoA hydrolase
MDEAAAVAAIRYARGSVLTAHVDAIDFRTPVPIGCFLEAIVALPRFDGQLDYAA